MSVKLSLNEWDEIDEIEKEVVYYERGRSENKERVPDSVRSICLEVDKKIASDETLTESTFRIYNEKATDEGAKEYLQKTLATSSYWSSCCSTGA